MTTTENNKLIAEFMDLSIKEGVCYYTDSDDMYPMGIEVEEPYIPYDESLEWLMKVVDKIFSLGYDYTIKPRHMIIKERMGEVVSECIGQDQSQKEVIFQAVIEFIKFYNQNK